MLCPSCSHENPQDAGFCGQCGASLAKPVTCPSCGRESPQPQKFCNGCGRPLADRAKHAAAPEPRSYTPKHLAEKILTSRSALEGERKQVTVLFADLKGSMDMSESIDPEEWHGIMDRFFRILADGVHRFEGTVNEYRGDGIMALFGAPLAHEDHAARACYSTLSLQKELRRYANELRIEKGISFAVRMGLNSGEVVVGKIGDDLRMDYTALGHTASLAARMEQIAAPDRAYLTEHTAKLVEGLFSLQDLGKLAVKGVKEPLRAYELQGAGLLHTKLEVSRARGFSKFVGREREITTLEDALERVLRGSGQVVGIVADPGVGKSRLCFEFLERTRAKGMPVYEGHGVSHGKSIPFLPILELFRNFFGISEQDSDQSAREKIAGRLLLLNEDPAEAIPLIFDFLGVRDPERPVPRMDPEARQRQLFAVVKRVMHARSRREPGVLLLEDLHWFDGASEGFLETMAEGAAATRTLLLLNFRPEYHARWMQRSFYQQLPLSPLGPEATRDLLADLLGNDPSLAALAETIHRRTVGNPFFTEEVVQSLIESGKLSGTRGAYRLATSVEALHVPPTVQSVLAARVDRLSERDKQVLQTAAVIGKNFSESILKKVSGLADSDLSASLSALAQGEFVYAEALYPEAEYAFKHPLTQEVAYGSQLAARRSKTHALVAQVIPALDPDRLDERAALLAHHWEAAGVRFEAARWHARAAEWAGTSDPVEALSHWRRVREHLKAVPESAESVRLGMTAAIQVLHFGWRMGSLSAFGGEAAEEEAATIFAEVRAVVERNGDRPSLVALLLSYGAVRGSSAGAIAEYVEHLGEAARIAGETGDPRLRAIVWPGVAYSHYLAGLLTEGARFLDRELAPLPKDHRIGADVTGYCPYPMAVVFRGFYFAVAGDLEGGARVAHHGLDLARQVRDPESASAAFFWLTQVAWLKGDVKAALDYAREGSEVAERVGSVFLRVWSHATLGLAHLAREEWDEALEQFGLSLELSRKRRTGIETEAYTLARIAEAHLGSGALETARAAALEGIAAAERHGTPIFEAFCRLALGRVLLGSAGARAAGEIEHQLTSALALLEGTGAKSYLPIVRVELAELARLVGDEAPRERELREAHRLFLEIGAPLRAASIAKELES